MFRYETFIFKIGFLFLTSSWAWAVTTGPGSCFSMVSGQVNKAMLERNQNPKRNGAVNSFSVSVQPKYTLEFLKQNRHRMKPGQSEFVLGESGSFKLFIEDRVIPGHKESQIVVVKYEKKNAPSEYAQLFGEDYSQPSENESVVRSLFAMRMIFEKHNLLQFIDVVTPLEYGKDFMVLPFVEGVSLPDLTLKTLLPLNPPAKYHRTNVESLGPPRQDQSPELFQLWKVQQERLQIILSVLKKEGFTIEDKTTAVSWSGIKYLTGFGAFNPQYSYVHNDFTGSRHLPIRFSVRDDLIVTTDGRLVITDSF